MLAARKTLTTEQSLLAVLERARTVGFLGPGPIRVHVDHARQFLAAVPETGEQRLLDMGSGGGLPGLPIFLERPDLTGTLLDASAKRCAFLTWAVVELGLADRVDVVTARAEEAAHRAELRGQFSVVVCRGFGPPSQTVECGMGFLTAGGRVVISEPPARRPWPEEELSLRGLTVDTGDSGIVTFILHSDPETSAPRPIKQQRRQPLFHLPD